MKSIILIRHAKSDWGDFRLHDADRPLNDRGRRNAPEMARRLLERVSAIDLIISSPAVRAATTAQFFAEAFRITPEGIQYEKSLYLPEPSVFSEVIREIPDTIERVCIFSHNPGITQFANQLSNATIDNMPTCSIFAVEMNSDSWAAFKSGKCVFSFFDYPRRLQQ